MVRGRGGVFEVTWDNQVLFSKKKSGRFPRHGEVEGIVEEHLASGGGASEEA